MSLIRKPTELIVGNTVRALIYGQPGCLSGATMLDIAAKYPDGRYSFHHTKSLKDIYERFNNLPRNGKGNYHAWGNDRDYMLPSVREEDGFIFYNKIIGVIESGIKTTYEVVTASGKVIRATDNHPFLCPDGIYRNLSELAAGSTIMVRQQVLGEFRSRKQRGSVRRQSETTVKFHPNGRVKVVNGCTYYRVSKPVFVYEAYMNNLTEDQYRELLNTKKPQDIKTINTETNHVHHVDRNWKNNNLSNLELKDALEHNRDHGYDKMGNIGRGIEDTIVSIGNPTDEMTYDVMMEAPYHNFVANEFIVHNSGKTTLALSAPAPLLLDFDGGIHRVSPQHQVPTVQVSKWEDVTEVLREDLTEFKTLVVDTAGKALDFMNKIIIQQNARLGKPDGSLTLQGYGARKQMFKAFLHEATQHGKHLIFVAHDSEEKEGDLRIYRPDVGGSSASDIVKDMDLVGYVQILNKKRTISFDPSEKFYGKNTANLPAIINLNELNNEGVKNQQMSLIFQEYNNVIRNKKALGESYNQLIADYKDTLASASDEESLNATIKQVETTNHIWDSKTVMALAFRERLKALNLTFKNGKYEKLSA